MNNERIDEVESSLSDEGKGCQYDASANKAVGFFAVSAPAAG